MTPLKLLVLTAILALSSQPAVSFSYIPFNFFWEWYEALDDRRDTYKISYGYFSEIGELEIEDLSPTLTHSVNSKNNSYYKVSANAIFVIEDPIPRSHRTQEINVRIEAFWSSEPSYGPVQPKTLEAFLAYINGFDNMRGASQIRAFKVGDDGTLIAGSYSLLRNVFTPRNTFSDDQAQELSRCAFQKACSRVNFFQMWHLRSAR